MVLTLEAYFHNLHINIIKGDYYEKFFATILTISLITNMALSASAVNETIDDKLNFINSKGIFVEEVINVETMDTDTKFTVKPVSTEEIAYITYSQESDKSITLFVEEGNLSNLITFKSDGTCLIDDKEVIVTQEAPFISPYTQYASNFHKTAPNVGGELYILW